MPCRIELSDIELMLSIGCGEAERATLQPVRFRASVRSDDKFAACRTDALGDTLDAAELQELIRAVASGSPVRTLERLGQLIEDACRERFSMRGCEWELAIFKPQFGWSYVHAWRS